MAKFNGQLRSNEIFGALFNMIISQEVFADNIKGDDLIDQARVDGGLHGDTKLYYSTDALASSEWGNDEEAANLLEIARPDAPKCQAIHIDNFRMINVTVDNYLSKRAWSDEGTFSQFNSIMLGWLRDTKKVSEGTRYNCFIGTCTATDEEGTAVASEIKEVTPTVAADAKQLAQALADIVTEMTDYSREFNGYGQLRRHSEAELKVIFNSKYINRIKNVDLPVIFDNAGLKATFSKEVLPARYFGTVVKTPVQSSQNTGQYRALVEQTIGGKHYFAGDKIAAGVEIPLITSVYHESTPACYEESDKVIAKIMVKLPPVMSAFETGTSFFNPRSLTENHYLVYSYNTLEELKAYPMVTVKVSE